MKDNLFEGSIFDSDSNKFTMIPNAFLDETDKEVLTHYSKWLWIMLKRYGGSDGKIMPSTKKLASKIICSEKTIYNAMTELIKKGYVIKFYRYDRKEKFQNSQLANGYIILKLDDDTGLPKKITNSELNFLINKANTIEDGIEWIIDKYFKENFIIF